MLDLEQTMQEHPVLGILRNIPLDKTIDYADAAIRGGVSFFEVALNSPCALQQIEMLRDKFGEQCLVGAGTAITPELCQQAIARVNLHALLMQCFPMGQCRPLH